MKSYFRLTHFVQGRSPLNPFLGGPPRRKVPENLRSEAARQAIHHTLFKHSCNSWRENSPEIYKPPGKNYSDSVWQMLLSYLCPEDVRARTLTAHYLLIDVIYNHGRELHWLYIYIHLIWGRKNSTFSSKIIFSTYFKLLFQWIIKTNALTLLKYKCKWRLLNELPAEVS